MGVENEFHHIKILVMTTLEKRVPKYIEVSNALKELILLGDLRPGDKLPTEKKLAQQFGVSIISIRGATRKLKEEGYILGIQGSGLYVSEPEEPVKTRNSNSVVFYTNLDEKYDHRYLPMLQSMVKAASIHNIRLEMLHPPHQDMAFLKDKNLINLLKTEQLRGLILFLNETMTWDDFRFLDESGIPFVINNMCRDPKGRGLISWHQDNWFEQMIKSMLAREYRKIAVLVGPMNKPEDFIIRLSQRMISAYKRIMGESGINMRPDYLMQVDWTAESGYVASKRLLSRPERPEVICAADDINAIGVIKAALDLGLSVPGDLKVWGQGDFLKPSFLSSSSWQLERKGRYLVSALIQVMEGDIPDQLPHVFELVERASTSEDDKDDVIRHWVEEYFIENPMDEELLKALEKKVQPVPLNGHEAA